VRGQVLGDGPSRRALAGTLRGFRQVDNPGDPDGEGFGAVVFDDHTAHYFVAVANIGDPAAAHIHAGTAAQNGPIAIDFEAQFTGGIAAGSVAVDENVESAVLAHPESYYFNVHNAELPERRRARAAAGHREPVHLSGGVAHRRPGRQRVAHRPAGAQPVG
jgi:hypothetical protein